MKRLLTKKQIDQFLKEHNTWKLNKKGTELSKTISFGTYLNGLMLVARIVVYAETLQHHPDILFKYGSLNIKLSTHEAKGLTKLDTDLARMIDHLLGL